MTEQEHKETASPSKPVKPGRAAGNSMRVCGSSELMTTVEQALRQVARLRSRTQKELGYNEEELVEELLLRLGTDPRPKVLRIVAGICSSHSLRQLIELGAKADAPEGKSGPLHAAAYQAREDHIRMLLAANADPNRKDGKGRSPLHVAALVKHPQGIRLLLAAGARVNDRDAENRTPLHYAGASDYGFRRNFSSNRLTATIRVLLMHGARLNLKDAEGRTAWQAAALKKFRDELLSHLATRQLIEKPSSSSAVMAL